MTILCIAAAPANKDEEMMAKLLYGECRGESVERQAAVVWVVLNRVDSKDFPNTIKGVITQKGQFSGYKKSFPVKATQLTIARDVIARWKTEKQCVGKSSIGRVIPKNYLFFANYKGKNRFRTSYRGKTYWDWSLPNPYKGTALWKK